MYESVEVSFTYRMARLAGAALLAAAASTATAAEMPGPLNPPQKVKVAYVPIMKFATMYVAAQRGLFKKYGLDVDFEQRQVRHRGDRISHAGQRRCRRHRHRHVAVELLESRAGDIRIIAPGGLEPFTNSPTMLLVSKTLSQEAEVKTIADLKGKTRRRGGRTRQWRRIPGDQGARARAPHDPRRRT